MAFGHGTAFLQRVVHIRVPCFKLPVDRLRGPFLTGGPRLRAGLSNPGEFVPPGVPEVPGFTVFDSGVGLEGNEAVVTDDRLVRHLPPREASRRAGGGHSEVYDRSGVGHVPHVGRDSICVEDLQPISVDDIFLHKPASTVKVWGAPKGAMCI